MKKLLLTAVSVIALAGTATAGIGNGKGVDKGNKNGWESSGGGYVGKVPPGLNVSGDNGRVDNGGGNGGENLEGNTPNRNGEDGSGDDDPN
ncbi:hypothetical protein [Marinovum sp.]|uniref:hypothetical protein n=1 Tax=Marinovum sp. TaxID=2024839 RepID=UPI003A93C81C